MKHSVLFYFRKIFEFIFLIFGILMLIGSIGNNDFYGYGIATFFLYLWFMLSDLFINLSIKYGKKVSIGKIIVMFLISFIIFIFVFPTDKSKLSHFIIYIILLIILTILMIVSKKNINNSSNNDESVIEETENVNEPIIKDVEEIIIDDKIDYSSEFEEINKKLKKYEKNNTSFSELALNLIALKNDIDEICNKAKTQNNFDIIKDSAKELKLKIDFTLIEIHNNFMDTVLNMEYEQSYKLVKNHFNELEKITNKENDYVINNMYLDINPVVDNYKTVYHNYHHAIIEDIVYDFEFLNIFDKNNQEIDPLYEEVEKFVIETQSASISLIQRKFQISRLRAGKIMDVLEDNGVVSSDNGTQSRIVYKH